MTDKDEAEAVAERKLGDIGPLRELGDEVRSYPVKLLRRIRDQERARGGPVPDHLLRLPPYLGDTALRALLQGGYVQRHMDTLDSIYSYTPTESGAALIVAIDGASRGDTGAAPPARRRAKAS